VKLEAILLLKAVEVVEVAALRASSATKKVISLVTVPLLELEEAAEVEIEHASSVAKKAICPENALKVVAAVAVLEHASSVAKKAICLANAHKVEVRQVAEAVVVEPVSNVAKKAICLVNVLKEEAEAVATVPALNANRKVTWLANVQMNKPKVDPTSAKTPEITAETMLEVVLTLLGEALLLMLASKLMVGVQTTMPTNLLQEEVVGENLSSENARTLFSF